MSLSRKFTIAALSGALIAFSLPAVAQSPDLEINAFIKPEPAQEKGPAKGRQHPPVSPDAGSDESKTQLPPFARFKTQLENVLKDIPQSYFKGLTSTCEGTAFEPMVALTPFGAAQTFGMNADPDGRKGIFAQIMHNDELVTYCLTTEQFQKFIEMDNGALSKKEQQLGQMRKLASSYDDEKQRQELDMLLDKIESAMRHTVHARNQAYFSVLNATEALNETKNEEQAPKIVEPPRPSPY
jgi:hypothetical protein